MIRIKEAEVMQMEMLEMELIKKLQNTQAIQKQAYMELEEAINNRPVLTSGGPGIFHHKGVVGGNNHNGLNAQMASLNMGSNQNDVGENH